MNKLTILIIVSFFLNNCSFNENSKIWKEKIKLENQVNTKKIFEDKKKIVSEFNKELKLDLSNITVKNIIIDNKNNYGSQNYNGTINKIGNYKFSKFKDVNQLNYKPLFLNNGIIFFDKKGSVIRYDNNQKTIWKNNYYSKSEKKLEPKLYFALDNENLIIADNIANYYSININSGKLNWLKKNTYPFNSEIKIVDKNFFIVDYKNTLKCYNLVDGSKCWSLQTDDSFTRSNSIFSIIIIGKKVIFSNSIGDITAVNIETGSIDWQLPTQDSNIINKTYNFKISKLVSDGSSIFFSNNKSEFYSIDVKSGTINWINEINSNITPTISGNLIFTVSNNGYLFVVKKDKGNIIRITDIFKNYKIKKRKYIDPIGFVIGNTNLYLTNTDGKIIVVDLISGNVSKIEKISGGISSKPFIFNQNLFLIRNGSIVQYN